MLTDVAPVMPPGPIPLGVRLIHRSVHLPRHDHVRPRILRHRLGGQGHAIEGAAIKGHRLLGHAPSMRPPGGRNYRLPAGGTTGSQQIAVTALPPEAPQPLSYRERTRFVR